MSTFILGLSVVLQLAAAGVALRLIKVTGRRLAWVLIASAIVLMGVRRMLTLYHLVIGQRVHVDIVAETIALLISVLMLTGVSLIAGVFRAFATAEEARRHSESRLANLVRSSPDGVVVLSGAGELKAANPAALHMLAQNGQELVGTFLSKIASVDERVRTALVSLVERADSTTAPAAEEIELPRENGAPLVLEASARRLESGADEGGVELTLRDISARKRAENLKQQLEKQAGEVRRLDSLGRLAGGIAHDFNNMLTVIIGGLSSGLIDVPETDEGRKALEDALAAADRAAELTRQLLAVGQKQAVTPARNDLNQTVATFQPLLERLIGDNVRMSFHYEAEAAWVGAERAQIEQIVVNLAVNARDSMPQGGELHFTVTTLALEPAASAVLSVPAGRYAVLSARDTGLGMDRATRERIFDPFFTTKEVGHGTGLGMATVYGIARQRGGQVVVDSEPGMGAEFRIYLPLLSAPAERGSQPPPTFPQKDVDVVSTILLAEDDSAVRKTLVRSLEAAGFTVVAAVDAKDAIEQAKALGYAIDALVTDVVMPSMSGPELAERLGGDIEGLRVLFVSGYSEEDFTRASGHIVTRVLQKPFTPDVLVREVRALLES